MCGNYNYAPYNKKKKKRKRKEATVASTLAMEIDSLAMGHHG
jgi:hypothetical protein